MKRGSGFGISFLVSQDSEVSSSPFLPFQRLAVPVCSGHSSSCSWVSVQPHTLMSCPVPEKALTEQDLPDAKAGFCQLRAALAAGIWEEACEVFVSFIFRTEAGCPRGCPLVPGPCCPLGPCTCLVGEEALHCLDLRHSTLRPVLTLTPHFSVFLFSFI